MAGGSNKKRFNKSNSRKHTKTSLFVEGGLLSDWSPVIDSSPSRGKSKKLNTNRNNSSNSKNKSAVRFEIGSSSAGKSKAPGSNTRIVGSQKPKMNAFAFKYPQTSPLVDEGGHGDNKLDESRPIVLLDSKESKIIAYMDKTPVPESETVKYTYDYGASFEADDSPDRGLGFHDESEENPSFVEASPLTENKEDSRFDSSSSDDMETDMMNDDDISSSPEKNAGYLSIGGMKLYTHDVSNDEDEDNEDNENDEESLDSSESEDSCNSSDSDGLYNSDSEIDDDIAKDYIEGIGGSYKVANVDELVGQVLDSSDEDDDDGGGRGDDTGGRLNETLKRLGGIALQDASREYGMKKPRSRKKTQAKPSKFGADLDDWSAIDDLMLVKNSRSLYGKKKHPAKLPQSWPSRAEKSKNFRRFPGEKKKIRQEMIASKRRERMINRGVDLEQINFKLKQMVLNGGDIMSFQLTHSRDCSQVQRIAAIYRLLSGSQGSGKRRFVTVTRTDHTGMPSSNDRLRLEKLLQAGVVEVDHTTSRNTSSTRAKKASQGPAGWSPLDPKPAKTKTKTSGGESSKKKRREKDKTGSYAAQPVSFISSGHMVSEPVEPKPTDQTLNDKKPGSSYGAFEMHTTGFGSRMMAKMGYVDGGGLGKDGSGIAEPIEVIQRPKSLGLGAKMPENNNPLEYATPPQRPNRTVSQGFRGSDSRGKSGNLQLGSFEKHTKGFGSKMMAKMGFVEGMGLGRDSQGMVNPLVASRLPKSRGLGAKG